MANNNPVIHITVETKELAGALAKVSTILPRRTALPILNDVLLTCDGGHFTLTGGNGESSLTIDARLNLIESPEKQWRVCLPADLLQAVKTLPMASGCIAQLFIDREQRTMRVTYLTLGEQQGEFSMPIEAADEYPAAPVLTDEKTQCRIEVPTAWLLPRLKAARVSVATDELRPQMACVAVDVVEHGGSVVVVSTDGHSLTKARLDIGIGSDATPLKAGQPATFLIHSSLLSTVCDVMQRTETVSIATDGLRTYVSGEGVSMVCVMPEERYPNYDSVIPKSNDKEVVASVADLVSALRRVSIFSCKSTNMGVLTFDDETLRIEACDIDFSRAAVETVRLQQTNIGGPFRIGVQIVSTLALLGIIETENVRITLADPSRPMLLMNEDVKSNLTALLMPMLVNEN